MPILNIPNLIPQPTLASSQAAYLRVESLRYSSEPLEGAENEMWSGWDNSWVIWESNKQIIQSTKNHLKGILHIDMFTHVCHTACQITCI